MPCLREMKASKRRVGHLFMVDKEEIKKKILARIERLREVSKLPESDSLMDEWEGTREQDDADFFRSPRWQEHLININKLWNIYSEEGSIRTGILHEINEGWALHQVFDSDEYRRLFRIFENEPGADRGKQGHLFRDSKKADRESIVPVLKMLHREMHQFNEYQRDFNAKLVRSLNTLFEMLNGIFNVQKTFNAETVRFINEYIGIEDPESQHVFLQERKRLNDRLEAFLRVLERRYQSSEMKIHREVKNLAELVSSVFSRFEQHWDGQIPPLQSPVPVPRKKIDDLEYSFFEDLWRGNIQDVKKKQKRYVPYFQNKKNVLDFGCGRGEFLELLAEAGIDSFGVEENEEMVSICKEKSLNVVCQNGLVYMHRISDHSLGGIFLSHVIEHLAYDEIMKLMHLCHRKLQKNGIVVMETINPCNFKAYFDNFIKDFTHKTPVHLDTLRFVMEMVGFRVLDVLKLSELKADEKLRKLDSRAANMDSDSIAAYNANVDLLNMILFGNQDYAVIAST